ncbi:MAG: hypothetical protein Q9227_003347 [Pyrenula ochraceoflavens]
MLQHVLLTGANGFIGSHILTQLLSRPSPPFIRAVVRSQAKADIVHAKFAHLSSASRLSFALVPDITAPGAFDRVLDTSPSDSPFDAVIHTASPFLYSATKSNIGWLEPAVKGTTEILKATQAFAPGVKMVVITSSFSAIANLTSLNQGKIYTADDWLPLTWDEVLHGDASMGYRGSKKFAEKAGKQFRMFELTIERESRTLTWVHFSVDYTAAKHPQFSITTLKPPMVYSPIAHAVSSVKDLNESNARIYNLFINSGKDAALPPNGFHAYVDPRDIARSHILAATSPQATNRRLIIAKSQIYSQQISAILRAKFPGELEARVPVGKPGTRLEVLGLAEMRSMEETLGEFGEQLLGIEKREGKVSKG